METVTDITISQDDPNVRILVCSTGTKTQLPAYFVDELNIKEGDEWGNELDSAITYFLESKEAEKIALQLISRKAWGKKELAKRLSKRGVTTEVAHAVTDQLELDGWLNDYVYACARIRELTRKEPAGRRFLTVKLQERLLDAQVIESAIQEEVGDVSEQDLATSLAKVRLAKIPAVDEQTARRRVIAALGRRGFSSDVGSEAIRRAQADCS